MENHRPETNEDRLFESTEELERQRINDAVRARFGISLKELGPPGSYQRETFIERFLAEEANNHKGD